MVSSDWCDDSDIDRQRRATVIRANSLMRKFYNCSEEVKLLLFNTFCSNMYCSHLWQSYKKATLNKLKVTYHNALRKLFGLQWDCSASNMFVSRHLTGFDALVRKYMAGFVNRLRAHLFSTQTQTGSSRTGSSYLFVKKRSNPNWFGLP